jgi:hypothetical protein
MKGVQGTHQDLNPLPSAGGRAALQFGCRTMPPSPTLEASSRSKTRQPVPVRSTRSDDWGADLIGSRHTQQARYSRATCGRHRRDADGARCRPTPPPRSRPFDMMRAADRGREFARARRHARAPAMFSRGMTAPRHHRDSAALLLASFTDSFLLERLLPEREGNGRLRFAGRSSRRVLRPSSAARSLRRSPATPARLRGRVNAS